MLLAEHVTERRLRGCPQHGLPHGGSGHHGFVRRHALECSQSKCCDTCKLYMVYQSRERYVLQVYPAKRGGILSLSHQ